ncbi:unnamed protein product, partial [Rhizoctonia solani]
RPRGPDPGPRTPASPWPNTRHVCDLFLEPMYIKQEGIPRCPNAGWLGLSIILMFTGTRCEERAAVCDGGTSGPTTSSSLNSLGNLGSRQDCAKYSTLFGQHEGVFDGFIGNEVVGWSSERCDRLSSKYLICEPKEISARQRNVLI